MVFGTVKRFLLPGIFALSLLVGGCDPSAPNANSSPSGGAGGTAVPTTDTDRSGGAFADTDPWILKTTDPNAARGNHGIFLGNGQIGATFGANGGAGKDALAFVAGVYDAQENLLPIGKWHDLGLPDPKAGEAYEQTLDMKRGVLSTKAGSVTVTAFLSAAEPQYGAMQVLGATPKGATGASDPAFFIEPVTESSGTLTRIGPASARGMATKTTPRNFDTFLKAHEAAWQKRWDQADITIEGDPEAQQLVHKLLFDLLQSAYPGSLNSIAPETLSGNFYKGHIFWDAEVWMFPALVALHPDLARPMLDYRFTHLKAAQDLAKKQGCAGADFPWESASSGKETAPGGFSQGRHVTAGVGYAVWLYWQATADKAWMTQKGWPLLSNVATYFATKAKKNAQTGKYDIKDITGPDEFEIGISNNTYTNALARKVLLAAGDAAKELGQKADPKWAEVANGLMMPFDKVKNRYLKFEGDQGKPGTKQADGELVLYPAGLPMEKVVAEATFDFHKARVIKNGPAMTDSIHALIAARLGRADEAEKDFRDSYRPFVRGPFLLFSEKRTMDRCVFTTGEGGILQSVIYGFGGLEYSRPTALIEGSATLPKTWTKLTIKGIHWKGKRYTLTVTPQGRTLAPL